MCKRSQWLNMVNRQTQMWFPALVSNTGSRKQEQPHGKLQQQQLHHASLPRLSEFCFGSWMRTGHAISYRLGPTSALGLHPVVFSDCVQFLCPFLSSFPQLLSHMLYKLKFLWSNSLLPSHYNSSVFLPDSQWIYKKWPVLMHYSTCKLEN